MNIGYTTVTGNYSPDGNQNHVDQFTPNGGEVWYIDALEFHTDYTNTDEYSGGVSVILGNANAPAPDPTNIPTEYQASVRPDSSECFNILHIDKYLTDSQTVYIADTQSQNRNYTIYYKLKLRRVQ